MILPVQSYRSIIARQHAKLPLLDAQEEAEGERQHSEQLKGAQSTVWDTGKSRSFIPK